MSPVVGWNLAAFAAVLCLSTSVAWFPRKPPADEPTGGARGQAPHVVQDHGGKAVRSTRYSRIVSASPLADGLLLELCEPDRVVAFTPYTARSRAFRFSGKPTVRLAEIEAILALHPDLVLVSGTGDVQPIARLRDAGLVVFDLGEPRGFDALVQNIHELANLIDAPERGDALATQVNDAMHTVAADVPPGRRRRGMYINSYGGRLFGGSIGTSYHDVLVAAGLIEAADRYNGWPSYTTEEVLEIDPEVVVTAADMRRRICEHAGLGALQACRAQGRIVEVDGATLSDPGLVMVEAARAVRQAVYGSPR